MKNVPVLNSVYNCFSDGKIKESRRCKFKVIEIIPFSEIDLEIKQIWLEEIEQCENLYNPITDFIIKACSVNDDGENIDLDDEYLFCRTLNQGWFSFGRAFWDSYEMDYDGSLYENMLKFEKEFYKK